jgi:hypothetical protein
VRGAESQIEQLAIPKDGAALTKGPSGLEAFLVMARGQPLPEHQNDSLKSLFVSGTKSERFDPLRGAVWIGTDEEWVGEKEDRARINFDATRAVNDPVALLQQMLRSDEVRGLSEIIRGVCFPFAGD